MKYRKLPVTVEATQWFRLGDHPNVVPYLTNLPPDANPRAFCEVCSINLARHGWIHTLEAGHRVCPGDWIITGVKSEQYPCKPDIFAATYELIDEGTQC